MRNGRNKGSASRLASRRIMSFHREHVGPTQGVKVGDASRAILEILKYENAHGNLKVSALSAIARHDGSLPVLAKSKPSPPSVSLKLAFYESWEWSILRMKALKSSEGRCECCGSAAGDLTVGGLSVRIQVDHIKPISKHWELRLDRDNLQVLCAECNKGKGAWDETDWRKGPLDGVVIEGWT